MYNKYNTLTIGEQICGHKEKKSSLVFGEKNMISDNNLYANGSLEYCNKLIDDNVVATCIA